MRKDIANLNETTDQQWHGISRTSFLSLYSETLAARSKVEAALDYDIDQLPDSTVMGNRESRFSRGYITWLTVYSRMEGERDIESEFFAVHSREPITPAAAFAQAQEGFETNAQQEHGTMSGKTFIGATYSGTWRMIPRVTQ